MYLKEYFIYRLKLKEILRYKDLIVTCRDAQYRHNEVETWNATRKYGERGKENSTKATEIDRERTK